MASCVGTAQESVRTPGVRGLLGGRLKSRIATFTLVDPYDPKTDMSAMMRTTAFPASIVVQALASGSISKRGGLLQERDVPADMFLDELEKRGIRIHYAIQSQRPTRRPQLSFRAKRGISSFALRRVQQILHRIRNDKC